MNRVAPRQSGLLSCGVGKLWIFLSRWAPVVAWMSLIFCASSDRGSSAHVSRIIAPLLHWLAPKLSPEAVDQVVFGVRKCAHVSEYGVLALLIWRARRPPDAPGPRPWRWSGAADACWIAVLYAATDEFHQTFIPSREGCVRDVLIDSAGAAAGLALLWFFSHRRRLRSVQAE